MSICDNRLTIIHVRLGVHHRVVTGIFGLHPASGESQMAQCQVTAFCPVERIFATPENPALSGIRLSGPSLLRLRQILHFLGALPLGLSLRIHCDPEDIAPFFVDRGIR